jgi:hypothetical protein
MASSKDCFLRRHRWVQVCSGRGQVSGGEEEYRCVLPEIAGVENPAVFGCGYVETVFFPKGRDSLLQNAGLAARGLHHVVFKP